MGCNTYVIAEYGHSPSLMHALIDLSAQTSESLDLASTVSAEAEQPGGEVAAKRRSRRRLSPCPPCPELPRNLTGNQVERVVMARVQHGGRKHRRNFSLRRHGTWEAAAEAAADWLRELKAKLPLIAAPACDARPGKRNRSGVVGVHLHIVRHSLRSGRCAEYPAYVSRWPGQAVGARWSFSTQHGEEAAFLMACVSRELRSANPLLVAEKLRELPPERREELLARRKPLPLPVAEAAA